MRIILDLCIEWLHLFCRKKEWKKLQVYNDIEKIRTNEPAKNIACLAPDSMPAGLSHIIYSNCFFSSIKILWTPSSVRIVLSFVWDAARMERLLFLLSLIRAWFKVHSIFKANVRKRYQNSYGIMDLPFCNRFTKSKITLRSQPRWISRFRSPISKSITTVLYPREASPNDKLAYYKNKKYNIWLERWKFLRLRMKNVYIIYTSCSSFADSSLARSYRDNFGQKTSWLNFRLLVRKYNNMRVSKNRNLCEKLITFMALLVSRWPIMDQGRNWNEQCCQIPCGN